MTKRSNLRQRTNLAKLNVLKDWITLTQSGVLLQCLYFWQRMSMLEKVNFSSTARSCIDNLAKEATTLDHLKEEPDKRRLAQQRDAELIEETHFYGLSNLHQTSMFYDAETQILMKNSAGLVMSIADCNGFRRDQTITLTFKEISRMSSNRSTNNSYKSTPRPLVTSDSSLLYSLKFLDIL